MKKIILMIAVVVSATISIVAQEQMVSRKSPEARTEGIVAKMRTALALSDDQVSKLTPVILKREQQREELRSKMDNTRDQHKQVNKEAEDHIKDILTPEQLQKLKQQRKEMHEKHIHKQHKSHTE
jgi:hypothetical protein